MQWCSAPNGVFSRPPTGKTEFHELHQPAPDNLEEIAFNVHQRFIRWLRRHDLLKSEPLSLERLSLAPDGDVVYQVKVTRHGNETQRVMSPMQFMGRLVGLIPPPYHPLLRYFGVFGPHAAWRKAVVPDVAPAADQPHDDGKPSEGSPTYSNSPVAQS